MEVRYSKPSADVLVEIGLELEQAERTRKDQFISVQKLKSAPIRKRCLLCNKIILPNLPVYLHRGARYFFCTECGHFQSLSMPPQECQMGGGRKGFSKIYPRLTRNQFESRRDRIYKPKLEWVLNVMDSRGLDKREILDKKWVELGCGAGYFLDVCVQAGVKHIMGIDADRELVERAQEMVPVAKSVHSVVPLHDSIRDNSADVYAAFFVFEHIERAEELYMSLAEKPTGTILIYAVPLFGFSALVDNLLENHPARMLDGAVHTQLYTEESINYSLNRAGYDMLAQWVFGADGIALAELLTLDMKRKMPEQYFSKFSNKLLSLIDPLQAAIDKLKFADQRHILAIKR